MSPLAAYQAAFVAQLFAPQDGARGGMAIHRRNALANLRDALRAAYPVVARLVGEAFFDEAARRHALSVPSRAGDLNAYGGEFPAFLACYPPAAAIACLPDVARLEWAMHECFHAPDAPAPDFARLAAALQHPEALRLGLHPAARLVASRHAVLAIWEANQSARDGTPARRGREHVLVHRHGDRVIAEALDVREWHFLRRLAQGEPLAGACEALGRHAATRLAPLLERRVRAGLFVDVEVAASRPR